MSENENPRIEQSDIGGKGPLNQDYANAYSMVKAWLKMDSQTPAGMRAFLKGAIKTSVQTYAERYTQRSELSEKFGIDAAASGTAIDAANRIVAEINQLLSSPESNRDRLKILVDGLDAIVYKGEIP